MNSSEVIVSPTATMFVGPDAVALCRAISLKHAINLYYKAGLKMSSKVSVKQMLLAATKYTGKSYKRTQYSEAVEDLDNWINTMKAAMPVTQEQ